MPEGLHKDRGFYRIGYRAWVFEFLSKGTTLCGRRFSAWSGAMAGMMYAKTHPDVVQVVVRNLGLLENRAFSTTEASRVFANFGRTMSDYFWLGGQSREAGYALAEVEADLANFQKLCSGSTGAILATGHYGLFEFGALVLGHLGYPISIVTHAEPTRSLSQWRADYRARWGAATIELGTDAFSSLRAVEAIEAGRLTAMLVDRPTSGRSLLAPLKGGTASFSMSPALLSWMTGCKVVPVTVRRLPTGRYAIRSGEAVQADRSQPRDIAIRECSLHMAQALVGDFQRDPLQWYHFEPLTTGP